MTRTEEKSKCRSCGVPMYGTGCRHSRCDVDQERCVACVREERKQLLAVAKGYLQWEADMILDQEAWHGGTAALPTLTDALWDKLLELQAMRNKALASPQPGREDVTQ